MWNIQEMKCFLDEQHITTVQAAQLEECRLICHLIDDDYDIEIRNQTFTGSPIPPVLGVKEGELVLIGVKRLATKDEITNAMSRAKTDTHRANMKRAWETGMKSHFDSRISATFSRVLRNAGYLTPTGHAKAPMTPKSIKVALENVMEHYLETNLPNRDELAIKLMSRDPSFIHLARDSSSSNVDFCIALVKAGHDVSLSRLSKSVTNDWRFIEAVRDSDVELTDIRALFTNETLNMMWQAAQHDALDELIEFQSAKAHAQAALTRLNVKLKSPAVAPTI